MSEYNITHIFLQETITLRSTQKNLSNFHYAPLRLGLCVNEKCGQYTKKGTPIWHDFGHITEQSSGELADLLRQHLTQTSINILNKD